MPSEAPILGRPVVERIHSSRHHNMKELRAAKDGVLRVLFMFDPRRQAILLIGGDKSEQWE
ncbi:MAG: type II toxin-antitoxin system RelE/ParE family toxin, partial [Acidimicrobiales bacterium]